MKYKIHVLFIITLLVSQAILAACTPETPTPVRTTETAAPTQPSAPTLTPTTLSIPPTPTPHPLSISLKTPTRSSSLVNGGKENHPESSGRRWLDDRHSHIHWRLYS